MKRKTANLSIKIMGKERAKRPNVVMHIGCTWVDGTEGKQSSEGASWCCGEVIFGILPGIFALSCNLTRNYDFVTLSRLLELFCSFRKISYQHETISEKYFFVQTL